MADRELQTTSKEEKDLGNAISLRCGFDCAILPDQKVAITMGICDFNKPRHLGIFIGAVRLCRKWCWEIAVNQWAFGFWGRF
jgi:hypothetical protein